MIKFFLFCISSRTTSEMCFVCFAFENLESKTFEPLRSIWQTLRSLLHLNTSSHLVDTQANKLRSLIFLRKSLILIFFSSLVFSPDYWTIGKQTAAAAEQIWFFHRIVTWIKVILKKRFNFKNQLTWSCRTYSVDFAV